MKYTVQAKDDITNEWHTIQCTNDLLDTKATLRYIVREVDKLSVWRILNHCKEVVYTTK